ncbi:MAG: prephenate dehydratase [Sphingobacteriaceae bacterium]|nr:MAG: prephenate dehydratase [Sphingobacteriaceae bacterium]
MNKPRVAIQGIKASFHQEAAVKFFGEDIELIECTSFKQTFEALSKKEADYVVMAIENSIAGSLLPNYSLMMNYNFPVVGEVSLRIQLHLLAYPGVKFDDIKYAISHPIALRQCVDFMEEYPQIKLIESTDTAACAKRVHDEKLTDTVAIANAMAAELYELDFLEKRIESNKKNYTRFLIMADKNSGTVADPNKASLCFQAGNEVGSLAKVLNILAENDINLSKIQSMPVLGKRSEYMFYADVEWQEATHYDAAIKQVLKHTQNFNILGEYRKNNKI